MQVRARRTALGWSQATLARRAGVSRQLVSAVESGRHEPGVSAALAIASALGVSVEALFADPENRPDVEPVVDAALPVGPVRVGVVRGRTVAVPVGVLDQLDGVVADGRWTGSHLELEAGARPAAVIMVGCEPALGVLTGLTVGGATALWVKASSGAARSALDAGRAHLAAVHDRADRLPPVPDDVAAFDVARWRVGIAFDRAHRSAADAVTDGAVAQRERSAASQAAFVRWLRWQGMAVPPGPRVAGHVEACRAVTDGAAAAAVTVEPVTVAAGLEFEPLEEHLVQLWCPRDLLADPEVALVLDRFHSGAFADRVAALPAYDTSVLGRTVA